MLVVTEPCGLMVGAQGKDLRTSEQVETRRQGKSIWSGCQDRPLSRTDGLRPMSVYSCTTQEDKLGLSLSVSTAYVGVIITSSG